MARLALGVYKVCVIIDLVVMYHLIAKQRFTDSNMLARPALGVYKVCVIIDLVVMYHLVAKQRFTDSNMSNPVTSFEVLASIYVSHQTPSLVVGFLSKSISIK